MNIILRFGRHIIIDHHLNVVNVYSARHDVGGHQDIYPPRLEIEHHVISLLLLKVAVHLSNTYLIGSQRLEQLFHLQFGRGEHNHLFRRTYTEQMAEERKLLGLIDRICSLLYLVCRLGDGQLHFRRTGKYLGCEHLYLRRHRSREKQRLPVFRQIANYLHYVLIESHIEHPVGLIKDEKRHF